MYSQYKWKVNSTRTKQTGQNLNRSQTSFRRNWNYNNNWNQNSNFHERNFVNHNLNRNWNTQRNCRRNFLVEPKRSNHLSNFSNKNSPGQLNANTVIKKIMALLWEKKKNESSRAKTKLVKREPLPPYSATTSIGEEGISDGFFCKFCSVFLVDKEQTDKHLLTNIHFRKYMEHRKQKYWVKNM